MRLVFLGRPGAGKGTQATRVVEEFALAHISTGDLLRAAMRAGTQLGREAAGYVEKGRLVPDELVVRLVAERLAAMGEDEGFVLDGFPRNIAQAEALDEVLASLGRGLDAVVYFSVRTETVIERLGGRRMCAGCGRNYHVKFMPTRKEGRCDECGGEVIQRKDDRPEAIRERLLIYDKETAPLIDLYRERDLLIEIAGDDEESAIARRVSEALSALAGRG